MLRVKALVRVTALKTLYSQYSYYSMTELTFTTLVVIRRSHKLLTSLVMNIVMRLLLPKSEVQG